MIKNYLKVAWRNILSNKFYSSINIIGLTTGLIVGILILLWVQDELSFDKFNKNADNLYRMSALMNTGDTKQIWRGVQGPIAPFALKEVPGIKNAARVVQNYYSTFKYSDKVLKGGKNGTWYADPPLFKMFDIVMLKGDGNKPFANDNSVIITQSMAEKFFGSDDPMGKVINCDNKDNYVVNGVVKDMPGNSSLQFDMLFSIEVRKKQYSKTDYWPSMDADWGNYYATTYLQLQPGTSAEVVGDKLTQIHIKHQEGTTLKDGHYLVQPLTKVHLYAADGADAGIQTVRVFLIVAVLILVIACINYINLSTARAMLRSKEVSVRKIIGAARLQLFMQFIVETALFFTIALAIAFIAIKVLMPSYNNLAGKQIQFSMFDAGVWEVIAITVIATLAAASIYPALLLSSFKPINALKGKLSMGIGNAAFRKALVVCQFVFSVGLIISTLIINKQLSYIHEHDLGYDRTHVFSFNMRDMHKNYNGVRSELLNSPGIHGITGANDYILNMGNTTGDTQWDGKDKDRQFLIHPLNVDGRFFSFFKLKMAAGESFRGEGADSAHYILNETAIREAGIKDPIGKHFSLHDKQGTIIGVVKDFHFASFKERIEPMIFAYREAPYLMFVKTTGAEAGKALASVKAEWKKYNPDFPFEYDFMDDIFDSMYKSDQRSASLFSIFTTVAILISCLGLFGLATYTAQVKAKEIGIRKVLGASVTNITAMLSKDFLLLVIISIVVAVPLAWYAMTKYLQDFVYKVEMQWWMFALSGLAAVLIAFVTISFQSIKAAIANPVKSLRSE
ncbi:ABC transporter permease [Mucilaginibacter mali]|uniref:ABC transporter permease n=1 Tax=Mucilaginibacter mali TaxID=2740462 RepID=A0A7D4TMJ5_9SPHI|nr:ABC transporter permease [Mucilaginibacter mali]QKJ30093.1 ABC transporter permease [Mucilaginibacter mali]